MTLPPSARTRISAWTDAYIANNDTPADTLAVSFDHRPLYLSDLKTLVEVLDKVTELHAPDTRLPWRCRDCLTRLPCPTLVALGDLA